MEPAKLDALARALSTSPLAPSRRGLLSGLAGGVAGLAGLSLLDDADAKKKKKGKGKKKKCSKKKKKAGKCGGGGGGGGPTPYNGPVFTVSGRQIRDTDGDPVTLRGVNKMSVFDDDDPNGDNYFPAIAATGANSVRIVWAIEDDNGRTTVSQLDKLITNCRANKMLPMIELHDATGVLGDVPKMVDYWVRDDVRTVIFKHSAYLLLNIANEAGEEGTSAQQWANTYKTAVKRLRDAQIKVPLVIDAPSFGKDLEAVVEGASQVLAVDSNLIFSVHPYWNRFVDPGDTPADAAFIEAQFEAARQAGFALIIGEFSKWGAYNGEVLSVCETKGETHYQAIMDTANAKGFGWYAWEWGPGNSFGDDTGKCVDMDMTGDNADRNKLRNVPWVNAVVSQLASAQPIFG